MKMHVMFLSGLFAFFVMESFASVLPHSCDELNNLTDNIKIPDYPKMRELKTQCERDLRESPSSKLLEAVQNLNIPTELDSAHRRRIIDRNKVLTRSRQVVEPLQAASRAAKLQLSDAYFAEQVLQLSKLEQETLLASKRNFVSYIKGPLSTAAEISAADQRHLLNSEAQGLAAALDKKIQEYGKKSNNQVADIDEKIKQVLKDGIKSITALRNGVTNALAARINEEILSGISGQTYNMRASEAWEKFYIKAKIQRLLDMTAIKFNSGRMESGLATLEYVETLHNNYINSMPSGIKDVLIKEKSPQLLKQLAQLREISKNQNVKNTDLRLKNYVEYRAKEFLENRANCSKKYVSQDKSMQKLSMDLGQLQSSSVTLSDSEISRYLYNSIADRLDIAVDLCSEKIS